MQCCLLVRSRRHSFHRQPTHPVRVGASRRELSVFYRHPPCAGGQSVYGTNLHVAHQSSVLLHAQHPADTPLSGLQHLDETTRLKSGQQGLSKRHVARETGAQQHCVLATVTFAWWLPSRCATQRSRVSPDNQSARSLALNSTYPPSAAELSTLSPDKSLVTLSDGSTLARDGSTCCRAPLSLVWAGAGRVE